MRVLLTGAAGFIGSQVARELLERGHDVRAPLRAGTDRARIADLAGRLELPLLDVFAAPEEELARAAEGVEVCIHAAWYAVPGEYLRSPENLACVHGTLRLIQALASSGVRRMVGVGSCFEYDFTPGLLSEHAAVDPRSLYAASKVATRYLGEQLAARHGISFAWARPFYQFGPHEDPRRLVPSVIGAFLRGEPVALSRGTQVRDFLHVRDVGAALAAIAASPLEGVVNVGSGRPVTVREIVTTLESQLGVKGLARFGARPENPTDPPFVCADVRKLTEGAGWEPRFDLAGGLADTIAWMRGRSPVS